MESLWVFKLGLIVSLLVLRDRPVYVLAMFGNAWGLLFMSFYTIV